MRTKLFSGICAAAFLLASAAGSDAIAKELKIQSTQNAGDATLIYMNEVLAPKLAKMTKGELSISFLPINAVVPYKEALDATSKGILDGIWASLEHYSGLDAGYALIANLISGFDTPDQVQMYCRFGGGVEVVQELHDKYFDKKLKVIGCGPYSREALVAGQPIRTFEDLKGIKIRAPEGMVADVFRRAGATPVSMPISEVYTALEKKIIDAADASTYLNNDSTGFNKIAKFPLYPGIHSMPNQQFVLSKKVWEGLGEVNQTILSVWHDALLVELRQYADLGDREAVARDLSGQGVKGIEIIDWPQAERDKLRRVARDAWAAFAEKGDLAKKAYETQIKFMERLGML